jgi:hypothetical protein
MRVVLLKLTSLALICNLPLASLVPVSVAGLIAT